MCCCKKDLVRDIIPCEDYCGKITPYNPNEEILDVIVYRALTGDETPRRCETCKAGGVLSSDLYSDSNVLGSSSHPDKCPSCGDKKIVYGSENRYCHKCECKEMDCYNKALEKGGECKEHVKDFTQKYEKRSDGYYHERGSNATEKLCIKCGELCERNKHDYCSNHFRPYECCQCKGLAKSPYLFENEIKHKCYGCGHEECSMCPSIEEEKSENKLEFNPYSNYNEIEYCQTTRYQ